MVHGGHDPLADLKPGTTVIVHYTADNTAQEIDCVGDGGLSTTEAMATKIDRGKKEITVKYDNGKIEKMKLTERAAADVGKDIKEDTRIVVDHWMKPAAKSHITSRRATLGEALSADDHEPPRAAPGVGANGCAAARGPRAASSSMRIMRASQRSYTMLSPGRRDHRRSPDRRADLGTTTGLLWIGEETAGAVRVTV